MNPLRFVILSCLPVLIAVAAGCSPPAVEKPSQTAPPPSEAPTFQDRPDLSR